MKTTLAAQPSSASEYQYNGSKDPSLQGPLGDREVENSLVVKLNFDKFELIKQLLKNRLKIVWCTKLERAESNEERARLEVLPFSSVKKSKDICSSCSAILSLQCLVCRAASTAYRVEPKFWHHKAV